MPAVPHAAPGTRSACRSRRRCRTGRAACSSTSTPAGTGAPRAGRAVELAARREQAVADLLGAQPAAVEPPVEVVVRVDLRRVLARAAGLLVGRGEQDGPVQRLDAPARRDELGGEPVEQFRVRRRPCRGCRSRSASSPAPCRSGAARCGSPSRGPSAGCPSTRSSRRVRAARCRPCRDRRGRRALRASAAARPSPSFSGSPRRCSCASCRLAFDHRERDVLLRGRARGARPAAAPARRCRCDSAARPARSARTSAAKCSSTQPTPSGPPGWASFTRPVMRHLARRSG